MEQSALLQITEPGQTIAPARKSLVGLSRAELIAEMASIGEKPFRAKQLWHWIYHQGQTDFSSMTTISKAMQSRLAELYSVERPQVAREQTSSDTTRKWLLQFPDGNEAETVYIPEEDRGSVCL